MASCSCIQGDNWNFSINSIDTYSFEYTDYSKWMVEEPYVVPHSYQIKITVPEYDKEVTLLVEAGASTVIDNEKLGIPDCLPDGFYCFEAYCCYNCGVGGEKSYTKQEAILLQTQCRIANYLSTTNDVDKGIEFKAKFEQIGEISSIGKVKEAQTLFRFLEKELDNYNCRNCCP